VGKGARVEENEIEEAEEHQQVKAEVRLHWVGVQGECGCRSTVVQRHGGGPVGNGGWRSRNWMEKKLATARACARGAREGARGPEEDMIGCKPELASRRRVWRSRQHRAEAQRRGGRTGRHGVGRAVALHVAEPT
jgi:hypothetical protein